MRLAINGFGRIGRLVFRVAWDHPDVEIVAVNDIGDLGCMAYLLKYDTVHGRFPHPIKAEGNSLFVGNREIKALGEKDPAKLPWKDLQVDLVVESTGIFRKREQISAHLAAGAKRVILTVPSKDKTDVDATVVYGLNHKALKAEQRLLSNASCTTNCLAPVVKVLHDTFGVAEGLMTTIHAYTNDQQILDLAHKDFRRARAAAVNIIPTSTGAAKAIGLVIPELAGKLNGVAIRVPVMDGSLVDLVATLKKEVSVAEVNEAMKKAAEGELKGVLEYTEDPIVSSDVIHNNASSIFDAQSTMLIDPKGKSKMVKIFVWYDNEWGYSCRVVDLARYLGKNFKD